MRLLSAVLTTSLLSTAFAVVPVVGSEPESKAAQTSVQEMSVSGISSGALKDDTVLEAAVDPLSQASREESLESLSGSTTPDILEPLETIDESEKIPADSLAVLTSKMTTKPFTVAGVTWAADSSADIVAVDVRLKENGQWSQWNSLDLLPSQPGDERVGSEPIVSDGATGIQVRLASLDAQAPDDIDVTLIDPGESTQDDLTDDESGPVSSADAGTGKVLKPTIVPREKWMGDGDAKYTTWTSDYSARLDAMYVHHTAGSNSYKESASAGIVRGIYLYHAKSMGWGDIGYQFLVDKYGNIFEGRHDAIEALPIGAQAGGFNSGTIGVSALGNYQEANPSNALIEAITQVLSWKAYQNGLNPQGKTKLLTGTSSKSTVKSAYGTYVTVPTILGHRDTNYTACPGINLYDKLPAIRKEVAKRVDKATKTYGSYVADLATPAVKAIPSTVYPVLLNDTVTFAWNAVKGATSYHILTRAAGTGGALGRDISWTRHKTVTTNSATLTFAEGQSRYIAVKAVSKTGHSFPVKITQITRPLHVSKASKSSGWSSKKSSKHYGGSALQATTSGKTLTFKTATATRKIAVVGTQSPHAGTVEIFVGGKSKGSVNFNASSNVESKVKILNLGTNVSGDVKIKTTGSGTQWQIAGVALLPPEQGEPTVPAKVSPTDSAAPPAPKVKAVPSTSAPIAYSNKVKYTWEAVKGATSYEFGTKEARFDKAMPASITVRKSVTGTSLKYTVGAGKTAQAYVRSVNAQGKKSQWVAFAKVNRPVADSLLTKSTGKKKWTKATSTLYYRGYAWRTSVKNSTIKIKKVKSAKAVALTFPTRSGRGKVDIYAGSKKIKTISLASSKKNYQKTTTVTFPKAYSGTITIKASTKKAVYVSAVTIVR